LFKLGVDSPLKSFIESEHLGKDLVSGTIAVSIVTYVTGCLNMYPVRTAVLLLIPDGFIIFDELLHESEVRALNLGVVGYVVVYKLMGLGPRLRSRIVFFGLRLGFSKLGGVGPVKLFRELEHLGEDLFSGTIVVSIVTYVTGCLNMYPVRTAVLLLL